MSNNVLHRGETQKEISWDILISRSASMEEFTEFEKEKIRLALLFLKEELGQDFLKNAREEKHPLLYYGVINSAPWTFKWIIWFADALKELKNREGYISLLSRIKEKDKFYEGLSVLEVSYKFSKVGFEIIIDQKINISGVQKMPDLKVIDREGNNLFVEVSISNESLKEREAFQTLWKISEPLWRHTPFIYYCGRIHRRLSPSHLMEIVNNIGKLVEKAIKDGKFHELIESDVIEIGISPESDKITLEKWARERGIRIGELYGPPYNTDEITRIGMKIAKEKNQLPAESPSIIVIKNNNLFVDVKNFREVISGLEEEIYRHEHILIVIIYGIMTGAGESLPLMEGQPAFIKKETPYLHTEQSFIFLNRFCKYKISANSISEIYNAFRSY